MKIGLYYFSGTGNTLLIAREFQKAFRAQGSDCELIPLEQITQKTHDISFNDFDMVGLGFPVHAFDAPRIVDDFIKLLPAKRVNYFLFKTAGSDFQLGGSTRRLRLALAERGWILKHESFLEMPPNVASNPSQERVDTVVAKARARVPEAVEQILTGKRIVLRDSYIQRALSIINHFENLGCFMGSSNWYTDKNCILCGKCVRACPTRNIRLSSEKISFGHSCIFCLRCWWNCPQRAIRHRHTQWALLKKPYKLG
ncbi:MAG TPA: EFR1 family ferrodoxin [Candidatus Cloacimonadota bacterium]|nr:EFR1 family ferrodoxin [Candidatus Cloacimonadota bacterium]